MTALNPLPSLIRASAQDAASAAMRRRAETAWSEDDYNLACETQERLTRSCYGRQTDHNQPDMCYIRFQIAEQLERSGAFSLKSKMSDIQAAIDAALA